MTRGRCARRSVGPVQQHRTSRGRLSDALVADVHLPVDWAEASNGLSR
ncbi:hypothetical protein I551_6342 [Mycobacterium ulcerans str. Harvey]|uniref:Transposase n=1 Tax=Mycobacterium ulcerans str. Harvey TaxID=1299332 RepID=A0ABP3ACC9_MYCUL|nr:hypothetical protein I551_6342 [Mycobacterium ulcerans str. Harvey]